MAVVLGVTGSIAAYKSCDLASKMVKEGLGVHVVMTGAAQGLIMPLTFQTLTGNPVVTGTFEPYTSPMPHISLADAAEVLVTAPATANILAKFACGLADDALSTLALSVSCPRIIAPAMNDRMWRNPAVQENVKKVRELGFLLVGPEEGDLACGTAGAGRMAAPETVLAEVLRVLGR
jgi:phosphopantothenoylcysteine decarboxylase/phosphopantothenate--cysteine ligase